MSEYAETADQKARDCGCPKVYCIICDRTCDLRALANCDRRRVALETNPKLIEDEAEIIRVRNKQHQL
jgi:hypothetical protein